MFSPKSPPLLLSILTLAFTASTSMANTKLAHRWSFDGNLDDRIGGKTARIIDADKDPKLGGKVKIGDSSVTLTGGNYYNSQYIDLGSDLMGDGKQVTIELWATQLKVLHWARIFNFSTDGGEANDQTSALFMSWNRLGEINQDMVEFSLANKTKTSAAKDTCAPYELEREYHIVITLNNFEKNKTRVTWYAAPTDAEDLGPKKGSFVSQINLDEFDDNFAYLGRSTWNNPVARAQYNEVRIYHSTLSAAQLEKSHDAGAKGIKVDIPESTTIPQLGGLTALLYALIRRRNLRA